MLPSPARPSAPARRLLGDLAMVTDVMVNCFLVGEPAAGDRGWVLVDAGLRPGGRRILRAAGRRFGPTARPAAIILTHGHFDHVGAVARLARMWEAPVFAHPLELPYLTGRSAYAPPDPSVGGGIIAWCARFYPRQPIDLADHVRALPADGTVPGLPDWRWLHTPGHTPGHVSLFRAGDRTLIAGDAFVTTRQESALAVLGQRPEVHGPPAYFTSDWVAAARSVRALAELHPALAATGHGPPLGGAALERGLALLARDFLGQAVPRRGRYVDHPAVADARGLVSFPAAPAHAPLPALDTMARVAGVLRRRLQRRRRTLRGALRRTRRRGPGDPGA